MGAANDNPVEDRSTLIDPALSLVGDGAADSCARVFSKSLMRGESLGRYVILEEIGAGGFGRVYAAYDPDLDRKVALKVMKTRWNALGTARDQLLHEAQALARLSHANVVTVYDVGDTGGEFYLSMEFVDGLTLKQWYLQETRSWRDVRDVMIDAGRGLACAHAAGIVHSDFKPNNVLVDTRGHVAVADFGLARALQQVTANGSRSPADSHISQYRRSTAISTTRSTPGALPLADELDFVAGSPPYMAPERFNGGEVDERSDQFSYCVALFEGLYRRKPFPQQTVEELRVAIGYGHIELPAVDSEVPQWLEDICLRGLRVSPHERFESMDELLAALSVNPGARKAQRRAVVVTAGLSAAAAIVLTTLIQADPTASELQRIDAIANEARAAAAMNFFIMPPVDAPKQPTAYTKVLAMEHLDGNYDPAADAEAGALRREFSTTLTRVGDYYWAAQYGRAFAIDYYSQAIVFDPSNDHARSRAEATLGRLAEFERKAAVLDFTEGELIAAEPLAAFAVPELALRAQRLRELASKRRRRSITAQESLDIVRGVMLEFAQSSSKEPTSEAGAASGFSRPLPALDAEAMQRVRKAVAAEKAVAEKAVAGLGGAAAVKQHRDGSAQEVVDVPVTKAQSWRRASRRDRKRSDAVVAVGRRLMKKGEMQRATQAFHRALRADRRNSAALMGLSDVHFELGDYHKAVEYGKRGVALHPRRTRYRVSLGDAYQKILRYAEARKEYEAAIAKGSQLGKRRLLQLRAKLGE
ncbi:MAG: serine/threonine-protein kinase [Nannocystaceae bacterium]